MNTENVEMDTEGGRYATFRHWTRHLDMPFHRLALAGFYHLPEINCVQCYACNLRIADDSWRREQRPAVIHEGRRPGCSHFSTRSTNVPLGSRNLTFQQGQPQQQPTTPFQNPCSPPSNHDSKSEPMFPGMSEPIDRMNTNNEFQQISEGQAKELAKAGLFCMTKDRILCHHCGYPIEKKTVNHNMKNLLKEHLKESPRCQSALKLIDQQNMTPATAARTKPGQIVGSLMRLSQYQTRNNQRAALAYTDGDDLLRHPRVCNVRADLQGSSATELRTSSSDSSHDRREASSKHSFGTGAQEDHKICHACLEAISIRSQAVYCEKCPAQYHRACYVRGCEEAACQAVTKRIRRHGDVERCQVAGCDSPTEPYLRTLDNNRNRQVGTTYYYNQSSKQMGLDVSCNQNRGLKRLPNADSRADRTEGLTLALPRPLSDRPRVRDPGELQRVDATGEPPIPPTVPPPASPPEGAVGGRVGAPEGQGHTCTDTRPPDGTACCVDYKFTVKFCLACQARTNRTCAVCKEYFNQRCLRLIAISCSNVYCQRWYHQEALGNHEAVTKALADLVNWICPKCKEDC